MLAATNPASAAPVGAIVPVTAAVEQVSIATVSTPTPTTTTASASATTTTATPAGKVAYLANGTAVNLPEARKAYLANGSAVALANSIPTPTTRSNAFRPATAASLFAQAPLMMSRNLPLYALVASYANGAPLDYEGQCLAVTVYHEARGESLEGQLAVANVVINRAKSGRYPATWCKVMMQPWQFSFVNPRTGRIPAIDQSSAAWAKAQAIARIAAFNVAAEVAPDVLWYHADYVAPSWGQRLTRVQKIGSHIFYRA